MVNYKPDGFHTLTPHIIVNDGIQALEFYAKAFGAESVVCMPGPGGQGVMHAEVKIGDSMLMLADQFGDMNKSAQTLGGTAVSLALFVEDCDAAFQRAVDAGATPIMPPADMFWGDRYCKVRDPEGHEWELSTHKEDLSPEEIGKRGEEFFKNFDPTQC